MTAPPVAIEAARVRQLNGAGERQAGGVRHRLPHRDCALRRARGEVVGEVALDGRVEVEQA
jgi:hypothetical protein